MSQQQECEVCHDGPAYQKQEIDGDGRPYLSFVHFEETPIDGGKTAFKHKVPSRTCIKVTGRPKYRPRSTLAVTCPKCSEIGFLSSSSTLPYVFHPDQKTAQMRISPRCGLTKALLNTLRNATTLAQTKGQRNQKQSDTATAKLPEILKTETVTQTQKVESILSWMHGELAKLESQYNVKKRDVIIKAAKKLERIGTPKSEICDILTKSLGGTSYVFQILGKQYKNSLQSERAKGRSGYKIIAESQFSENQYEDEEQAQDEEAEEQGDYTYAHSLDSLMSVPNWKREVEKMDPQDCKTLLKEAVNRLLRL